MPTKKNKKTKKSKRAYRKGGKLPKFQAGGLMTPSKINAPFSNTNVVGQTIDAIRGIQPDTSGVTNAANQLQQFNSQIQAQTGPMSQTAGQLSQFNPLQGQVGSTLQGFIQSGNAVDVNPLVQAAQTRAQQGFQDFMGQTNEQLGALGLGSSSTRDAILAREAGRLQGQIGATGLEAGVAAQESARGRQLQAFNPLLQGSGQQLQGLGTAGALQGQAAGLDLSGQEATAGNRLAALQGAGQLQQGAAGLNLQGQMGQAGQFNQLSGTLVPPTVGLNQQPQPAAPQPRRPSYLSTGIGAQRGGQIPQRRSQDRQQKRVDLGDFLGQLTFGQQFTRPETQDFSLQQFAAPTPRPRGGSRVLRTGPRHQPTSGGRRPGMRDIDQFELLGRAGQESLGTFGHSGSALTRQGAQRLGRLASFLGPNNVAANMRSAGQGFANMASSTAGAASRQESDALSALIRAIQGKQEGGVVPGPAVPPDTVPILAQGGEGVIPVHLMHELENADSSNPLIQKLQVLMSKGPDKQPSKSAIQRKQRGGKISKVMGEFKRGTLKSSDGKAVTDRKQAIAIALSEAGEAEGKQQGGYVTPAEAAEKAPVQEMQHGGPIPTQRGNELLNFVGPQVPSGVPSFSLTGDPNQPPEVSQGRVISPTEEAEQRYQEARGRSALLRSLAFETPRGAMPKFAPIIGQAEQEEQSALENLQLAQEREAGSQQVAAEIFSRAAEQDAARQFEAMEGEKDREAREEAARIRAEGIFGAFPEGAGGGANAVPQPQMQVPQSAGGVTAPPQAAPAQLQAAPPPAPVDPVQAVLQSTPPEEIAASIQEMLSRMPDLPVTPELQAVALGAIQQLIERGLSDEEIEARHGILLQLVS